MTHQKTFFFVQTHAYSRDKGKRHWMRQAGFAFGVGIMNAVMSNDVLVRLMAAFG